MKKFFEDIKNFFIRIRASDETTRKRWLYIFTAVAMLVILGIWLLYVRVSFGLLTSPDLGEPKAGIFAIMGKGGAKIYDTVRTRTANTIYYFKNLFGAENVIELKPPTGINSTLNSTSSEYYKKLQEQLNLQ